MNKEEFFELFLQQLESIANVTEERLDFSVPRNFLIKLYGLGKSGVHMTPKEAIDLLYLGNDRFFQFVDISVIGVSDNYTEIFVRPSDRPPVQFDKTINQSTGSGPFKQLIAGKIRRF